MPKIPQYSPGSAAEAGLASCETCMHLTPSEESTCAFCGTHLHVRIPNSVQTSIAFLITAIIFFFPANIYPIMTTTVLGHPKDSTIISGVILFAKHGDYFVAAVILIASILIPIAKIIAITWLCINAVRYRPRDDKQLIKLYQVTEFIGKWSMIDVFVVAISAALAQIGSIITIKANTAALAFAVVVIASMFAAISIDTRLIWDNSVRSKGNNYDG